MSIARTDFGLADSVELDRLEITWPDSTRPALTAPAANTLLTVQRVNR